MWGSGREYLSALNAAFLLSKRFLIQNARPGTKKFPWDRRDQMLGIGNRRFFVTTCCTHERVTEFYRFLLKNSIYSASRYSWNIMMMTHTLGRATRQMPIQTYQRQCTKPVGKPRKMEMMEAQNSWNPMPTARIQLGKPPQSPRCARLPSRWRLYNNQDVSPAKSLLSPHTNAQCTISCSLFLSHK